MRPKAAAPSGIKFAGENQSIFLSPPTMQGARVSFNLYHHQELNLTPVQVRGAYVNFEHSVSGDVKNSLL